MGIDETYSFFITTYLCIYHELMNEIRININNGTFDQFFDEYIGKL